MKGLDILYCQCFYNIYRSKSYSGYILLCGSNLICSEVKSFEAKTEYEAIIKILNRMIYKIVQADTGRLRKSQLIIEIRNQQLKNDLLSNNEKDDLDCSIKGLFKFIYDSIKKYNIKLVDDLFQYVYGGNGIESEFMVAEYLSMYQLFHKISLLIIKSKGVVEELYMQLSNKDMAIQDILHFIELTEINDEKKIEFIDTLKKLRLERRKIKDELELSKVFNNSFSRIETKLKGTLSVCKHVDKSSLLQLYKPMFATKVARQKILSSY
jgi:hypothetical protein